MKIIIIVLAVAVLSLTGCASLLPTTKQTVRSPWESFENAKQAFDKILPYSTTAQDLVILGFDPFSTPNIRIMTYLDIMNVFMPNPSIGREQLAQGIQACIDAREGCKAYKLEPKMVNTKRDGNIILDLFNFRRNTNSSGWRFDALIVLIDNTVVYKLWGGSPIINENDEAFNPLGPLQNPGEMVKGAIRP